MKMSGMAAVLMAGFLAAECASAAVEAKPAPARALPRVLIIGDSVSLGYTPTVVAALEGKALVEHNTNPDNAASTKQGLASLDTWLGSNSWDVIHFNWGLWDINRRVNGKRNLNGPIATSPEDYEARLEKLVVRLKETKAVLLWAPITYCSGGFGRVKGDDVTYNAIAAKIMQKHGIAIDDLHALTSAFPPNLFKSAGNVHFSEEGYKKIGAQVAESILKAVEKTNPPAR